MKQQSTIDFNWQYMCRFCEKALKDGRVSDVELKVLEEMYEQYVNVFHGNGYVKTMMTKVRELPVIG